MLREKLITSSNEEEEVMVDKISGQRIDSEGSALNMSEKALSLVQMPVRTITVTSENVRVVSGP